MTVVPAPPQQPERRSAPRTALVRPAEVRRGDRCAPPARSFAVEVSAAGCLLAGPPELAVGDDLWISVDAAPDLPPEPRHGRVARITGAGFKAVALD